MKISHEWLARFVPHGREATAIRDLITAHVATVEGFERLRADLATFVVARVVESERIPETKLSFNKVDDGSGTLLEVVCGAPNVAVGAMYPFARSGTRVPPSAKNPAGLLIEKRKIRGFTSNGMLCSAQELNLGDDADGILTLETSAAPGTPLLDVLPLGDVRLEVDVLPNRPDLLSHRGLAREIAALTGTALESPAELAALPAVPAAVRGDTEVSAGGLRVRLEDATDCPQYGAAVITGLTVGPSPAWLKAAVESVGGRSINNIVDATNYLLHGLGQPVHAFDAATLAGDSIIVRRARASETLVTLDGTERKLDPQMLVIADAERATAIAGVMGGRASEVTATTTRVVLEVAEFAPRVVRTSRRKAGLSTDASYRFERGIDSAGVAEVLALGAALLAQVGGGRVETTMLVGAVPAARASVTLRPSRVALLLGERVPAAEITALLGGIGFVVTPSGEALTVTPPSWRHDVTREVDLIEEVARLRGFDRLPDALQGARPGTVPDHPLFTTYRRVRDALVAEGLLEVRPLPFTSGRVPGRDALEADLVRVINPLGDDEPFLRRSVLETLARRAEYNLNRMQGDVRLFEVGTVFQAQGTALPREEQRVGVLLMGRRRPVHFTEPQPPAFDEWDAQSLAARLGAAAFPGATIALVPAEEPYLWKVQAGGVTVGEVRRLALDAPVWAKPAFGIEIALGVISSAMVAGRGAHAHATAPERPRPAAPVRYTALPTTPAAEFDLALLVPDAVSAGQVEALIRSVSGTQLERCELFDQFRGAGVPDGARSLAWRLTFRHPERTLRDKEIEGRRVQLLKTLEAQLGVRPRTA